MADVRLISGADRYADPWHDFPATSGEVAAILGDLGHRVELRTDVEEAIAAPTDVDLLVVNIANPAKRGGETPTAQQSLATLSEYLRAGGGLLSLHSSATSFPNVDAWEEILGGRWVDGQSMHPPLGPARVRVRTGLHPIVDGLEDFTVPDERYSHLRIASWIVPLAEQLHDGRMHPLLWARRLGAGRVVYDALGHGVESYRSAARCAMLIRSVRWLLGELAETGPSSAQQWLLKKE